MLPSISTAESPTRCATPPSGWYYNYPKHKKPAASLERKLNYKGEERLLAKEWYEQQLANYPDVLTVAQVCEVTGYQRHTILKWCSKGLLKTILQTPKYMIPKVWLLEFVTSDFSTRSAENVENTMLQSRKSVIQAKIDNVSESSENLSGSGKKKSIHRAISTFCHDIVPTSKTSESNFMF